MDEDIVIAFGLMLFMSVMAGCIIIGGIALLLEEINGDRNKNRNTNNRRS